MHILILLGWLNRPRLLKCGRAEVCRVSWLSFNQAGSMPALIIFYILTKYINDHIFFIVLNKK